MLQKKINQGTDTLKKIDNATKRVSQYTNHSVDSIQRGFRHRTDSIQRAYAMPMKELQKSIAKLNHKKDSLSKLKLPTKSIKHQLDSVKREQAKKQKELNSKIDKVRKETLGKIQSLNLPPEAKKEVDALTKNVKGFSMPGNFFNLPSTNLGLPNMPNVASPNMANMPQGNLSNLSLPSGNTSIPNLNLNKPLSSVTQVENTVTKDAKQLQSMKDKANADAVEKDVENAAKQNDEVKALTKDEQQLKGLEKKLSSAKNADSLAMQQLKPAVNHFAGKEKELQSAMGEISKLKQKYSSVKSLSELPKRRPNPLKDKPWYERLVPGLNYFIMSKHSTLVDLNPYVGWRFNPHLTASIGWNERIGVSKGNIITHRYERVFGVRGAVSYLWTHGIVFKAAPEVMDAFVPTTSPDQKQERLIFGAFAGVRKHFPIYKGLIGYSEVLYNFNQKPGQNIYGDPVTFRFGLEVRMKKKQKKN
ncbi:MAG: hypothetical protein QM734_15380 [Cyclobacteriaceae bacterium]